jgi:hypothetical protein
VADYLTQHVFVYNISRCNGMPGDATDTNTLERGHLQLKSENYHSASCSM